MPPASVPVTKVVRPVSLARATTPAACAVPHPAVDIVERPQPTQTIVNGKPTTSTIPGDDPHPSPPNHDAHPPNPRTPNTRTPELGVYRRR